MQHDLIYKTENYKIIGICMEVYNILGGGLAEIIYKDALEYEFQQQKIAFAREKEYLIEYKDIILPRRFYADFVVYDNIIFEVKAVGRITDEHVAQTLNYMKLAKSRLGILVNFGGSSLEHKRLVL